MAGQGAECYRSLTMKVEKTRPRPEPLPQGAHGEGMGLNCDASDGLIDVELLDEQDRSIPGFTAEKGRFEGVNGTAIALKWRKSDLSELKTRIVRLQFGLRRARIYSLRQDSL